MKKNILLVLAIIAASLAIVAGSAASPVSKPSPNVTCCVDGGGPPIPCNNYWWGWHTAWNGRDWVCSNYPFWHWQAD